MKYIDDKSIDMILCDLPYGTTACKWDSIIPFEPLWKQYERIIKDNGAIILTADEPFTSQLINSNIKKFRYKWIWEKSYTTGFMNANKMPLKNIEDVLVFYKKLPTYNPQGVIRVNKKQNRRKDKETTIYNNMGLKEGEYTQKLTNYPNQIIKTNKKEFGLHPTQKPVELFEYLIKTYTNEGETVLDNCMGSGTTAIACINTNRNYIGFELDENYFEIANKRISSIKEIKQKFYYGVNMNYIKLKNELSHFISNNRLFRNKPNRDDILFLAEAFSKILDDIKCLDNNNNIIK
jgi:site-specific DNA-methyltransferase (adenine-specific)